MDLPIIGTLRLPAPDEVAFVGGVAVLVMIGVVEWPIGVALGVGHALATNRRNRVLRSFGEALEEA
jgi:xanthosine utilization system XapX-like protein